MTYGDELINPEISSWPYKLGELLNISEIVNYGLCGRSNDYILRTTLDYCADYVLNNKMDDLFVVIGWTEILRFELWDDINNKYRHIQQIDNKKSSDLYEFITKYKSNICNNSLNKLNNILTLQLFLEKFNIKFLFFDAVAEISMNTDLIIKSIKNVKYNKFDNLISHSKRLELIKFVTAQKKTISVSMYDFCENNNYKFGPNLHPLEEGHEAWANYLYNYIKENDILITV